MRKFAPPGGRQIRRGGDQMRFQILSEGQVRMIGEGFLKLQSPGIQGLVQPLELSVSGVHRKIENLGDRKNLDLPQLDSKGLKVLNMFEQFAPNIVHRILQRARREHGHMCLGVTLGDKLASQPIQELA